MILRTLAVGALLMGLHGPVVAQDPVLPARSAEHYAEADLARITSLVGLRADQVEDCRRMLVMNETALFERRENLRREIALLEKEYLRNFSTVTRTMEPEQAEQLLRTMKAGELPLTWEVAEPGSVRGIDAGPAKSGPVKKSGTSGRPTSPTTLSR
ncbi:MAG TPA: hypothetical protein PLH93_06565 [Flavobacteriales bacterium]|nr:hypothetical protein [Flavobacteriales bacterium]HQW86827.1 hypothetical protein [Flavobacteriales bacterium]